MTKGEERLHAAWELPHVHGYQYRYQDSREKKKFSSSVYDEPGAQYMPMIFALSLGVYFWRPESPPCRRFTEDLKDL